MSLTLIEAALDFNAAAAYRKKATILKANVRIATDVEKIDTIVEGKLERSGSTEAGDYVITGGKGEEYIIKAAKFPTLYEENPANPAEYRSKNFGLAIVASDELSITRTDGTTVNAKAGDVLFQSKVTNTVNVIDKEIFAKDYRQEARM